MVRTKRVAVLGGGTVGGEVVQMLQRRPDVELGGVLVRDDRRPRPFSAWQDLVTTDEARVLTGADVVVEVMGGVDRAVDLSLRALASGAVLVSANKAALAERWDDFLPYLRHGKVHLEAAVMAGTPVIGPLTNALRGSQPRRLDAVLNGTCNVILAAMEHAVPYEDALSDAQRAGFAEADPTLDVDGIDAAHKLALLARLVFDPELAWSDVRERARGIRGLSANRVAEARAQGRRIRLVGSIAPSEGGWQARVRPVSLPDGHPLVTEGPVNAMTFVGEPLGSVLVRGPGAGGGATASGVVGDVLAALEGRPGPRPVAEAAPLAGTHAAASAADGPDGAPDAADGSEVFTEVEV
ncbi:MAG: homoserine dehydrogenase [Trueperaceae bacterium]